MRAPWSVHPFSKTKSHYLHATLWETEGCWFWRLGSVEALKRQWKQFFNCRRWRWCGYRFLFCLHVLIRFFFFFNVILIQATRKQASLCQQGHCSQPPPFVQLVLPKGMAQWQRVLAGVPGATPLLELPSASPPRRRFLVCTEETGCAGNSTHVAFLCTRSFYNHSLLSKIPIILWP